MSTKKTIAETPGIWDFDDRMDTSSVDEIPMNLKATISYFSDIEEKCDQAIQDQDALIREITKRIPGSRASDDAKGLRVPLTLSPTARTDIRTSDLPYDEFRKVADLANKVMEQQMPMATKRFMSQAGRHEVDQIEQFEINITILRQHMRNVEQQIMNYTPRTSADVALKLKFLSALMLDGGEIEQDYFAYLVEECAEILADDITLMQSL